MMGKQSVYWRRALKHASVTGLLALVLGVWSFWSAPSSWAETRNNRPNIVVILADDLGYGDLSSYGATKIQTPNMDRIAAEGMRFTDAHAPHSVCTPTRYSLLTGRYAWRTWNGHTTVWADDPLLIDTNRLTVPKLMKSVGYKTALIGKWHLGFGALGIPGWDDKKGPDYNKELKPGPLEVGFDYYFGVPHVGQYPHIFIENHRVVNLDPRDPIHIELDEKWEKAKVSYLERLGVPAHRFTGGKKARYDHEDLAVTLTQKAVQWIAEQEKKDEPFFLYFAHRNPHAPIAPNERFKGTSAIGPYGDFLNELDWSVGEILAALERGGFADDTLVILSSDNGGVSDYKPSKVAEINGHRINGPLFGQKTEAYEGGNRVPLVIKWPAVVDAGTESNALVALTDFLATAADLFDVSLPYNAGEDSFSFLPVLTKTKAEAPVRGDLVMDSSGGVFAVREGPWKLIMGQGGGGVLAAENGADDTMPKGQLYNLANDLGETENLYDQHPALVARLAWRLKEIQFSGRSHPVVIEPRTEKKAQE